MTAKGRASTQGLDPESLQVLLSVGRELVSELDLAVVLNRLVDVARELTDARYAALGVLNQERTELERFITSGISAERRRQMGELPRGRGILGELIRRPEPLRLTDIGAHPRSYGLPPGHPSMASFLGVPVTIRGEAYGNLYLTEKAGGPFDERDEQALLVLADWAAIAIDNARLYEDVARRREELETAVRGLEATTEIARAVGAETNLARVLELIVKRGRALVDARAMAIFLHEGERLVLSAAAGELARGEDDEISVPVAGTAVGDAFRTGRSARLSAGEGIARLNRVAPGARAALVVALTYRARPSGVLVALDRKAHGPHFDDEDEGLVQAFAASAATAVATAQSVRSERLRHSIESAEQERRRWARELHDETLQGLGALRVVLETGLRSGDPEQLLAAVREGVAQSGDEIEKLQALIAELRPASLDELGLDAAIESLAERTAAMEGLVVDVDVSVPRERLSQEVESAAYRLCQEALTNVSKHARAENVNLRVAVEGNALKVSVHDDGRGFDPGEPASGYGLLGMAERAQLLGGSLELTSAPGEGTSVSVSLPLEGDGDRSAAGEYGSGLGTDSR